jgi:HK97 family phage major capsid protein
VVELPDMDDVAANKIPVVFGDFQAGFRIYDRTQLQVMRDPYSVQTQGLVRFHGRRRLAGGVVRGEAFKLLKVAA